MVTTGLGQGRGLVTAMVAASQTMETLMGPGGEFGVCGYFSDRYYYCFYYC